MVNLTKFFNSNKDNLLIRVISLFWLLSKIWSINAWLPGRTIPHIPLFSFLENSDYLVFGCSLASSVVLFFLLIFRIKKLLIITVVILETIVVMCDYLFLQPWEYIFLFVFTVNVLYSGRPEKVLHVVRLFIASVYIFSGLHKLDRIFLTTVWNRIFLNDYLGLPQETVLHYKLFFVGLIIPVLETALGILLLIPKFSKKSGYMLILMHALILILVDPLGLKNNSIIWIWNFAMICILLCLKWLNPGPTKQNLLWYLPIFVIPLVAILFSSTSYLTFNLFTGKNDHIYVFSKEKFSKEIGAKPLPATEKPYQYYFNLFEITMKETSLSPPPEKWYQKRMIDKLQIKFPNSKIIVDEPPN